MTGVNTCIILQDKTRVDFYCSDAEMRKRVDRQMDSIMDAVVERRTVNCGTSCSIVKGKRLVLWPEGVKATRVYEGEKNEEIESEKENNN